MSTASQILEATFEVTTWVTKLAGGDGTGSRVFVERFAPGDTLAFDNGAGLESGTIASVGTTQVRSASSTSI